MITLGAIILEAESLLLLRKRNTRFFVFPGGKKEEHESDLDCLTREM